MKDIDKIYRIVSAVNKASSVSVTVKLRKGFDEAHCNALEAAKAAQAGGAAAVKVHGRDARAVLLRESGLGRGWCG